MSFNCRGLVGPLKRPTLKRVISSKHPDVLLLQETLGEGEEVKSRLKSFLPGWEFETLDAMGRSGGLALGWNTQTIKVTNSWGMESGLGITILVPELGEEFHILNIYGPYQNRGPFWDTLFNKSFLKDHLVILGGDLNFSLGQSEVWGLHARTDPLAGYFTQKLVDRKLIDVEPTRLKPTWRNNRVGEDRVAKRLDWFLVADSLLENKLLMKQVDRLWGNFRPLSDLL
jgi:exonuclease III